MIIALPGLGDTHTRVSGLHLTVSQYSLAGCEPNTVLMAKNDTLGEAWIALKLAGPTPIRRSSQGHSTPARTPRTSER